MKGKWLLIWVVWLLLVGAASADDGVTAEIAQVNTSKYPEVTLYVSVVDRAGQIVEGLAQEDFRITEDGAAVDVIAFSAGSRTAIATVLTIDRSGSMSVENKLEGAKTAATTFVDLMREHDRVALVAFDNRVVTLQPFTSDKTALKNQIRALSTGDCTAWYDGVYQSVDLITPLDGRRSVVLLSDGIDCREDLVRRVLGNGSSHDLDEAIQHALTAGIPVYAIGLGQRATQQVGNEGFDEVKLRRVALETNGKYYHAPSAAELKQLYSSLSVTMQKEYVVTYRSPRPTYDGTRRNIVVSIQTSGGPGAMARGRYLEQHLVNIRSDLRLFMALLLPLLLLAAAPVAWGKARGNKGVSRQVDKGGAGAPAPPRSPELAVQPAAAVSVQGPLMAPLPLAPAVSMLPPQSPAVRLLARFPLGPAETTIGGATDNAIVLSDPSVAAHHARISRLGERYVVRDLSNGQTYVSFRGDPVQERPTGENALQDGSSLRFGQVRGVMRQPAAGSGAWLEIALTLKSPTIIGRTIGGNIVVNQPQVAAQQVELRDEGGRWVVNDAGSGAGLFVSFGGDIAHFRPVQGRNALKPGSKLRLGDVIFELQVAS